MKPRPSVPAQSTQTLYLDWNVVIDLCEGLDPSLAEAIHAAKRRGVIVPFSVAHVVDSGVVDPTRSPDQQAVAEARLQFLSELTADVLITGVEAVGSAILVARPPATLREMARFIYLQTAALRPITALYSPAFKKSWRNAFQLDPNRLNNVRPPGALQKLDEEIVQQATAAGVGDPEQFTLRWLIANAPDWQLFGQTLDKAHVLVACVEHLNFIGYFPDRSSTTTWASFVDGEHLLAAASATAFISADRALRAKAAAIYDYLRLRTRVLSPAEAVAFVQSLAV